MLRRSFLITLVACAPPTTLAGQEPEKLVSIPCARISKSADIETLFNDLVACSAEIAKTGQALNPVFAKSHKQNFDYVRNFMATYDTLTNLQGPNIEMAFTTEHAKTQKKFEGDLKDVAKELVKLQPYSIDFFDGHNFGDETHADYEEDQKELVARNRETDHTDTEPVMEEAAEEEITTGAKKPKKPEGVYYEYANEHSPFKNPIFDAAEQCSQPRLNSEDEQKKLSRENKKDCELCISSNGDKKHEMKYHDRCHGAQY